MTARILLFAKAPVPGHAKTRLIPALGAEGAALLQQRLTLHTLSTALGSGLPMELWCHPDPHHPFFATCAEIFGITCRAQQGGDLGARMQHAAAAALGQGPVVLIGTDCPGLTAADLIAAADALAETDAVLGPAIDGGYYLLGLRQLDAVLFEGVSWGTDAVLTQTRRRLTALGWRWRELRRRADIDRPEDLALLPPHLHQSTEDTPCNGSTACPGSP